MGKSWSLRSCSSESYLQMLQRMTSEKLFEELERSKYNSSKIETAASPVVSASSPSQMLPKLKRRFVHIKEQRLLDKAADWNALVRNLKLDKGAVEIHAHPAEGVAEESVPGPGTGVEMTLTGGGAIGDLVTTMMRDREIGIGAEVTVVTAVTVVTVVTEIEVTVTAVTAVIAVIAEGIGATVTVATAIAVIGATVAVIEKGTTGTTGRTETRATLVMTPELQKASPEMVEDHGPLMAFPGRVKPLARLAMPMRTPTSEFKMQGLRRMKPRPL
mmetsp:Transcript_31393/g.67674  ORF Transcript_31393/g.67674 Transcript_31393/m.67674 type:complete len:273 (-) Transcript_31393:612-1430(-)